MILDDGTIGVIYPGSVDPELLEELASSDPELLDMLTHPAFGMSDVGSLVFVNEPIPGRVGLNDEDEAFDLLVVRVAEAIQEVIMESHRYFGAAFPPCPEHPNTPLWANSVEGAATWVCIDGGTTAVPIGALTAGT